MGRTYWESGQHDEVKGASPLLMFNLPLAKNADKKQIITHMAKAGVLPHNTWHFCVKPINTEQTRYVKEIWGIFFCC